MKVESLNVSTAFIRALALGSVLVSACTMPPEDTESDTSDIRALTQAEILGEIHYGDSKGPIDYKPRPRFRAFWFNGAVGDRLSVRATSSNGTATVYVADANFADLPGGADAVLTKTGKYYVAIRDAKSKPATLTVKLDRVNSPPSRKVADVAVASNGTCVELVPSGVRCWGKVASDYFASGYAPSPRKTPENGQMPATHRFLPTHENIGFDFIGATPPSGQTVTASKAPYEDSGHAFFMTKLDGESPLAILSDDCAWFAGRIRCRAAGNKVVDFDFGGDQFASGAVGSHEDFACAVSASGDAKCWGRNFNGELGTGDERSRGVGDPDQDVDADLTSLNPINLGTGAKVISMAIGSDYDQSWEHHVCALLATGSVKCWGAGGKLQLGNETPVKGRGTLPGDMGDALPALPLLGKARAVFAFGQSTCAALEDGRLQCFGELPYFFKPVMRFPSPVRKLVVSAKSRDFVPRHACVLLEDQSLRCWGANYEKQLGISGVGDVLDYVDGLPMVVIP